MNRTGKVAALVAMMAAIPAAIAHGRPAPDFAAPFADPPSRAAWEKAETRHFTVIANTRPDDLSRMATQLEQLDQVARMIFSVPDSEASAANKVTVYVLPTIEDVRRMCGACRGVAGFYVPRAGGSIAFTPLNNDAAISAQTVLFHEYGHHFLLGNDMLAYPAWFSEGFAEFLSTTKFAGDHIDVGTAAVHRAAGLLTQDQLPVAMLFQPPARALRPEEVESLYGKGWLLTHYLLFDSQRAKALRAYVTAINQGVPNLKAAEQAFGDLKELDKQLTPFLRGRSLPGIRLPLSELKPVTVKVTALTPGAAALASLREQSERGVDPDTAGPLYKRAASIAAAFPRDATAQGWLAEMAYDARDDAAAESAADRALAVDPASVQALIYKGRVRVRHAAATHADAAGWKEARSWFVKANHFDNDDAEALELYYESFGTAGEPLTDSARKGIFRAQELVPQDGALRLLAVHQAVVDGHGDQARQLLRPLAYNPHAGPKNNAVKLMALLDGPDGIHAAQSFFTTPEGASLVARVP